MRRFLLFLTLLSLVGCQSTGPMSLGPKTLKRGDPDLARRTHAPPPVTVNPEMVAPDQRKAVARPLHRPPRRRGSAQERTERVRLTLPAELVIVK